MTHVRTESKSVVLSGLGMVYPGGVQALSDVNLDIQPGEFVSFLGPSGCGKTTTLKIVAGLERATSGGVHVGGTDISNVPMNRRRMGVVFQNYALFPHMTVHQNIEFGLKMHGVDKQDRDKQVSESLELVGLEGMSDRLPKQLSGGQQQRVALARAIVTRPDVLLLDESLAALDKRLRQRMQHELKALQKELGVTTVFVTHDQEEALTMSDRVVVMNEGRISQVGTPEELYRRPRNWFVLEFLGAVNVLRGTVTHIDGVNARVALDDQDSGLTIENQEFDVGAKVLVASRPEDLRLAVPEDQRDDYLSLPATFETTAFAGARIRHYFDCGGAKLMVDTSGSVHDESAACRTVYWPRGSIVLPDDHRAGVEDPAVPAESR